MKRRYEQKSIYLWIDCIILWKKMKYICEIYWTHDEKEEEEEEAENIAKWIWDIDIFKST